MRVRRMQSRFNSGDLNTHANALTLQRLKTKLKALRDKLPKLKLVHDNETKNT